MLDERARQHLQRSLQASKSLVFQVNDLLNLTEAEDSDFNVGVPLGPEDIRGREWNTWVAKHYMLTSLHQMLSIPRARYKRVLYTANHGSIDPRGEH